MNIHGDHKSGNCYKVELMAALLGIELKWIDIDILAGDTQSKEFLLLNPLGKIPLLQLDDGRVLTESNAIINFLAYDSDWLPKDRFALAQAQQWQFFEQYSLEPNIAVARYINVYLGLPESRKADYAAKQTGGHRALKVMEQRLSHHSCLVSKQPSVADISLYAYTHVAHEGGFDLSQYPAIEHWLKRIELLPNYKAMASD
jgi:glutathione S-transferase